MSSFLVESVVRGFHVYKQVWHATAGEELRIHCRRDLGNSHDPYAVAMVRASNIVGHVPKRISSILFAISFFAVEGLLLALSLGADNIQVIYHKEAWKFPVY